MTTQHKHHDAIVAWAKGSKVQMQVGDSFWFDIEHPSWDVATEYRVKPEEKPDYARFSRVDVHGADELTGSQRIMSNVKFTFDGETNRLKAVEMI